MLLPNDGSVLLSCKTTLALHLIQPRSQIKLSSPMDQLNQKYNGSSKENKTSIFEGPQLKTRSAYSNAHEVQGQATTSVSTNKVQKPGMNKLVTSREQMLSSYPDIFEGISTFPRPPYHIEVDPNVTPKQTPCRPVPIHLKEACSRKR